MASHRFEPPLIIGNWGMFLQMFKEDTSGYNVFPLNLLMTGRSEIGR